MTPTGRDESLNPVHDPAIDRAWQATRSEEPSAALDDLIRAAARREVGAGPRAQPARFRAWMPLAAAATVAIVAFGIVQMAPPGMMSTQIASTSSPSIAERNAAAPSPTASATKSAGFTNASPDAPAAASAKTEARATDAASVGGSPQQPQQPRQPSAEAATKSQAASPMHDAPRATAAVPVARPAAPAAPAPAIQSAATDAAAPAAMSTAPPATPPAAAPRATTDLARRSEPFPASEADEAVVVAGGAARADTVQRESSPPQSASKREAGGTAFAQAARVKTASADAPLQAPAARTLDDWIVLLRRLKAEGRDEQLTRELIAFRALYKDRANDLLPADLRDLKR